MKELNWTAVHAVSAKALHPGSGGVAVELGAAKRSGAAGGWTLTVPLQRGMALVTAKLN